MRSFLQPPRVEHALSTVDTMTGRERKRPATLGSFHRACRFQLHLPCPILLRRQPLSPSYEPHLGLHLRPVQALLMTAIVDRVMILIANSKRPP